MATTQLPLGWIEPADRTNEQIDAHDRVMRAMPKFSMPSRGTPPKGTKILLTDLWKHALVKAALGSNYTGSHQRTGSCVWAGAQNVVTTVNFVEVVKRGEPEQLILPFVLPNYGKSRQYAGMYGRGEGSLGSTMARSLTLDGSGNALDAGRPSFTRVDGFDWGADTEMRWSDGAAVPADVLAESRKHPVKTATPLSDGGAVRDAILNLYPVTRAFGSFVNPGSARVKNGVLIANGYDGRGGHQESWLGYWHHPDLGELIWEQNQWGLDVYGQDPAGGPGGGLWLPIDVVDRACQSRDAEIFAFSQYEGYPAQELHWLI